MDLSQCPITENIDGNICIGDTIDIINENFSKLDDALCSLGSEVFALSASNGIAIDVDDLTASFSVRLKTGGGLTFDGGEIKLVNPSYIDIPGDGMDISVTGASATHTVKLKNAGGLEFDDNGEIKLSPSNSMYYIAIRPSHPDSSDDIYLAREYNISDPNVLIPYFKTLNGAISYARQNIAGNVTVFVDEDCNLKDSFSFTASSTLAGRYVTESELDDLGLLGDGYLEGLYVWNKIIMILLV